MAERSSVSPSAACKSRGDTEYVAILRTFYALTMVLALVAGLGVERSGVYEPTIPDWQLAVAVGLGMSLTAVQFVWKVVRYACTYLHELAHAIAAVLMGGNVQSITYQPDASGLARFSLPMEFGQARLMIAAGAGYTGPGVAGIATVAAVVGGAEEYWLLAAAIFAGAGMLLLVRSLWGALYSAGLAAMLLFLVIRLEGQWIAWAAGIWAGVLLAGGVRGALIQVRERNLANTDAGQIGGILHVPARLVAKFQYALAWVLLLCGCWIALRGSVSI